MSVHPDVEADWRAAETALGTRLPSDYMSFMDTYGVGDIEELVIFPPLSIDVPNLSDCHIGSMGEGLRWVWEKEGGPPLDLRTLLACRQ